jgi:glutathione S-transferase/RNA polymerase-associated protein
MIQLYDHPLSPYAQKVRIALREKGVDFEAVTPMGLGAGSGMEDFLAASPRGEVPALIDGETRVFDSTIILEYLDETWPKPPLLPESPAERARVRMIEEVMDTHYEAINWALGEIGWFKRAEGELASELVEAARLQTAGFHTWLEGQLGERTWFNGAAFGRGDLSVVPYVAASAALGNPPPERSRLAAWLARALERPSVAATVGEARGFDRGTVDVADLVKRGLFKREYRDHRLEWMMKSGGCDIVLAGLAADNIRFAPDFG